MGFRADSAASWPAFLLPGSNLTFRANTDAGIVFVVGDYYSSSAGAYTFRTPLPAAFCPLATVYPVDVADTVSLSITPAGVVSINAAAGADPYWRSFYLTGVSPG